MDNQHSLIDRFKAFVTTYKFPLVLGVIGTSIFGYGLLSLQTSSKKEEEVVFTAVKDSSQTMKPTQSPATIVVDVAGAVKKPGVYSLAADARVRDAILIAGGMEADADHAFVAKTINLAAKLMDGGKLYVPYTGETSGQVVLGQTSSGASLGIEAQQLIDINTAGETELDTLPGIGKVTAGKIIANRPYTALDELLSKKVVNAGVFEQIKDKVTIY